MSRKALGALSRALPTHRHITDLAQSVRVGTRPERDQQGYLFSMGKVEMGRQVGDDSWCSALVQAI